MDITCDELAEFEGPAIPDFLTGIESAEYELRKQAGCAYVDEEATLALIMHGFTAACNCEICKQEARRCPRLLFGNSRPI